MNKARIIRWGLARLKEPSTYAGVATAALAMAEIAKDAEGVAATFKEAGPLLGVSALVTAVAAIIKPEKPHKDDNIIDAEYTVVKDK